jgi:Flp pilus assembly protein TadD
MTVDLLAQSFYFARRYDQVIGELDRIADMAPDDWWLFALRGIAYVHKGEFSRAIPDLQKGRSLGELVPHAVI